MRELILFAICVTLVRSENSKCTAYRHCQDVNDHKTYKNGDVWTSVNNTENTCADCICMESKEYTVSCVDLEVANKSSLASVKKKNLLHDIAKGFPKDNDNVVHDELEVESEEVAFNVRCKKGAVPTYNPKSEAIVIRHSHYYYISRIMYCCKKPPVFEFVVPECKIVFDDLCSAKVVRRADESMDCSEFIYA